MEQNILQNISAAPNFLFYDKICKKKTFFFFFFFWTIKLPAVFIKLSFPPIIGASVIANGVLEISVTQEHPLNREFSFVFLPPSRDKSCKKVWNNNLYISSKIIAGDLFGKINSILKIEWVRLIFSIWWKFKLFHFTSWDFNSESDCPCIWTCINTFNTRIINWYRHHFHRKWKW